MIKKSILLFVILSVIASGLNYIVYPLFSRILAPEEYVNITISLSLFTQVSAFLSSILAITIGLSKSEHADNANAKINQLQAFLFKFFLVLAVIFLALSPIIMERVNTPPLFAIPISLMMLLSIPLLVISGYLNGKNQMVKLGLVTVISASSQFTVGLIAAAVSHNGLITMLSMALAQIITLILIYTIFSKDHLPGIRASLQSTSSPKHIRPLVIYAAATSIAIMAISLVQIADLFVIQQLQTADMKFYADIYVVSRVVFFGGMIFIWPFLGEISIDHHHVNRKPFIKVVSYFTVITLTAIVALYFFGTELAHLLFGANYDLQLIREIGILSVIYKFLLLIITAVVLYFVVLRNYTAVWFSALVSGVVILFMELIHKSLSISAVLGWLTLIAGGLTLMAVALLLMMPIRKSH